MLPIMHTLAFFANLSIVTKILGQLHIFQAPSQYKTRVGVQLKNNYYLQGAKCTLHCDHKSLEPFLSRGMKIAKLDICAMLLQEYDITFVHIKGKDNILANAISRLCTLDIYEKAIETKHSPVVKTTTTLQENTVEHIQHIDSAPLPRSLKMNSATLHTLQKQDKFCKSKAHELHSGINSSFYLNTDGILKHTLIINNLELRMTVVPLALTNMLIHKFYNCTGHQVCARTLNTLKRKFGGKACKNMLIIISTIVLHALQIFLMFHVTLNYI